MKGPWFTLVATLLVVVGCGGESGTFAPNRSPAMLGGNWAGTVALTAQSPTAFSQTRYPVSATITQSNRSVSGEFAATTMSGGFTAEVSGTDLAGTLTLRGSDGCVATASMRGVVDGPELRLSAPSIGVGACDWSAQLLMTLRRP
jgi:hypothetical protein